MVKPKSERLWVVYLSPTIFRLEGIFDVLSTMGAILKFGAFGVEDQEIVDTFQKLGYLVVFPAKVEEDHVFGPRLFFGKDSPYATMQVPWSEVLYILNVSQEAAQPIMGFAKQSN